MSMNKIKFCRQCGERLGSNNIAIRNPHSEFHHLCSEKFNRFCPTTGKRLSEIPNALRAPTDVPRQSPFVPFSQSGAIESYKNGEARSEAMMIDNYQLS